MSSKVAPVLLFVHGTNFCKEIWGPIQRFLLETPLLVRKPDVEMVSMDLPYHGSKRDESVPAIIDEAAATVDHPASKFVSLNTDALYHEVQRLRTNDEGKRRPIVGVGHSMGATALWNVEAQNPGTFEGLVLFEPFVEEPGTRDAKTQRYIFNLALKRQHRWPSREEAACYFENAKALKTWDRESLSCWLAGALVPEEEGSKAVVLACHPSIEAAMYCGERLWLTDSKMSGVGCPVTFHSSDNTWLFDREFFAGVERRWPRIYTNHPPMKNTTHNVVMEKPKECADAIQADLSKLQCFTPAFAKL